MSADKSSSKIAKPSGKAQTGNGRSKRPSALMQVASTVSTNVDASLEDFIAKANATLHNVEGWGLPPEDPKLHEVEAGRVEAETRASQAEKRIRDVEAKTEAVLQEAQTRLAEAEARAAAAEQRARLAERAAKKSASVALPTPERVTSVEKPAPVLRPQATSSRPKWGVLALVFLAGGALAFGAVKLMADSNNSNSGAPASAVEAPTPSVVEPDELEQEMEPMAIEPASADSEPAVQPLVEPTPEVKPMDEAVADPEPVKAEPVKPEPVKAEPVKAEPVKPEPVKAEPVKAEPVKAEPVKAEPVKAKPTKAPEKAPKSKPAKEKQPKTEPKKKESGGIVDPFA